MEHQHTALLLNCVLGFTKHFHGQDKFLISRMLINLEMNKITFLYVILRASQQLCLILQMRKLRLRSVVTYTK